MCQQHMLKSCFRMYVKLILGETIKPWMARVTNTNFYVIARFWWIWIRRTLLTWIKCTVDYCWVLIYQKVSAWYRSNGSLTYHDSYSAQGAPIRAHIIACIHFVFSCRAMCANSPFGPVKPALHIQSTFMSLSSGEFEFFHIKCMHRL